MQRYIWIPFAMIMLLSGCKENQPAYEPKPNIIVILSDDMGFSDIGCYGSEISTPELDKLAADGLRFSQFYNTARCCPTRAALLTGLYPAQTGMGFMTNDEGEPGYKGEIGKQCVTLAEVLGSAGYSTYMAGKWHVAKNTKDIDSLKYNWPLQRGFDKFYGTINGADSFWDPATLTRGNEYISAFNDAAYKPKDQYYYTDAISDNAVSFIETHSRDASNEPFFMYVAYTAAHWPLHAPEEEIARYKGKYDKGYAEIRQKRFERLKNEGLVDEQWQLSDQTAKWDTTTNKTWHARNMEVYAAMISRMDRGIGQIVNELESKKMLDNTLILYLQDNGGCAETLGWISARKLYKYDTLTSSPVYEPMEQEELQSLAVPIQNREGFPVVVMSEKVMAGSDQTYHAYGPHWANVSNTPFRKYKHWVHEGGIATPLIAHWPEKIKDKGQIRRQPCHVIDIMATLVDISGAPYPDHYNGHNILPMEGKSLAEVFTNNENIKRKAIFFEHEGNRGVRQGAWKLVSKGYGFSRKYIRKDMIPKNEWALFNMEADRTEINNLASEYPEKVAEMAEIWQEWAERTNTIPKPK